MEHVQDDVHAACSHADDDSDVALICIQLQSETCDKPLNGDNSVASEHIYHKEYAQSESVHQDSKVRRERTTFVDGNFETQGTTSSLQSESGKLIVDKASHPDPWPTRVAILLVIAYFAVGIVWFALRPTELNDKHTSMSQSTAVVDAMYFTVTTLTTVGYGDVAPIGEGSHAPF